MERQTYQDGFDQGKNVGWIEALEWVIGRSGDGDQYAIGDAIRKVAELKSEA